MVLELLPSFYQAIMTQINKQVSAPLNTFPQDLTQMMEE
jgi:hypothetical protein